MCLSHTHTHADSAYKNGQTAGPLPVVKIYYIALSLLACSSVKQTSAVESYVFLSRSNDLERAALVVATLLSLSANLMLRPRSLECGFTCSGPRSLVVYPAAAVI